SLRPLTETSAFIGAVADRFGLKAGAGLHEAAKAFASLSDTDARDAFLHTLRSVVDPAGQRISALPRLDVSARHPSLIVRGARDPIVPIRQGEQVHELVPHTYLARFANAGHFPHRDDPDRFVKVVDEFLAREWGVAPPSDTALRA